MFVNINKSLSPVEKDKECPEPIPFGFTDPLGESYLIDDLHEFQSVEDFDSTTDDMFLSPSRYKLAEQVHQTTMTWAEKYKVMESITLATRVLASRHIVMKSLALAAIQPPEKIATSLDELGLADVNLLVKLLYLSVSSKLFMPKQADSKTLLDEVSDCYVRPCATYSMPRILSIF